MKSFTKVIWGALFLLPFAASAEKTGVKVTDIEGKDDTSIVIKKGPVTDQCVQYEILSGSEEVFGMAEYDRSKAYTSWKTACEDWKKGMREMNKGNQLLSLNCNSPKATKEDERFTFQSAGTYKMRLKMRDKM